MTRPVEPTWPTADEAMVAWRLSTRYTNDSAGLARCAVEMAQAAWRASVDDPSLDLPGTVRTSPDGEVYARCAAMDRDNLRWVRMSAFVGRTGGTMWLADDNVRGWSHTQSIAGTPAWDAAMAEDQS